MIYFGKRKPISIFHVL